MSFSTHHHGSDLESFHSSLLNPHLSPSSTPPFSVSIYFISLLPLLPLYSPPLPHHLYSLEHHLPSTTIPSPSTSFSHISHVYLVLSFLSSAIFTIVISLLFFFYSHPEFSSFPSFLLPCLTAIVCFLLFYYVTVAVKIYLAF